ncbi:MAG: hypothetical protein KGL11_12095 [Alphaproteobacteria bacterium]|nr:hypothetical protein [Alphaproteobacteria bacterium]
MAGKKQDATNALVIVVKALDPLPDAEKQWVLQSAASRWSLNIQAAGAGAGRPQPGAAAGVIAAVTGAPTADVESAIAKKDARAFIRIKRPITDVQRVACLGYFLVQTTGQHGFSSKDIGKAHTESGGPNINMTRALDNATRQSKYLSRRSAKEKQLTTLGEDVVLALPDQQAVKEAEAAEKSRRRGRTKRKSGKTA